MRGPVLDVLKLVLRVSRKLNPDFFHKNPEITAIFVKKDFKFFPGDKDIQIFFYCMAAFILCLTNANAILKKKTTNSLQLFLFVLAMSK